MPVFETERGTRLDLHLPSTRWPEMQKAKENYERLRAERKATQQRLGSLRVKREKAVEADRVALAQALKDGKDDPGEAKVDQIDKEMLACNRRLEALEVALDDAETDLIAVVDDHRDPWLEEANEKLDSAYEKYAAAVEVLSEAADAVSSCWALVRWVKNFPEDMSYRPRSGYVHSLQAPHGDPYALHQVMEALRADAKRPEPAPVIPWGAAATAMLEGKT